MRYKEIEPDASELEKWEIQLRKGSFSLAVLATLWDKELYGLEILRRLEQSAGFTGSVVTNFLAGGSFQSAWG
jgi:hypothetical protein